MSTTGGHAHLFNNIHDVSYINQFKKTYLKKEWLADYKNILLKEVLLGNQFFPILIFIVACEILDSWHMHAWFYFRFLLIVYINN